MVKELKLRYVLLMAIVMIISSTIFPSNIGHASMYYMIDAESASIDQYNDLTDNGVTHWGI
jgi:hypothetical protein